MSQCSSSPKLVSYDNMKGWRQSTLLHSAHDNYRWSRFILKILSAFWAAQGVISRREWGTHVCYWGFHVQCWVMEKLLLMASWRCLETGQNAIDTNSGTANNNEWYVAELVNISNTLNDGRKALWFPTFSFLGRGSISYPSRKDDRKTHLEAAVLFEYGKEGPLGRRGALGATQNK